MNLRKRLSKSTPEFHREFALDSSSDMSFTLRASVSDRGNASAERVNRTHRVVRERAKTIAARRSKIRSLWAPLLIFSTLLVGICTAVWAVIDEYEISAAGTQVSSYQILVPLFWSVPVSAALLAVVWFRQTRSQSRGNAGQGPIE